MSETTTNNCSECGAETKAKNTMGDHGGVLCGPCKRQEQYRVRVNKERESHICCGETMEQVDDGIYQCWLGTQCEA